MVWLSCGSRTGRRCLETVLLLCTFYSLLGPEGVQRGRGGTGRYTEKNDNYEEWKIGTENTVIRVTRHSAVNLDSSMLKEQDKGGKVF